MVLLRYLLWVGDEAVHEAAERVLHSVMDERRAEELMRSYGEQLIERGRQQGREEGWKEGRKEGLTQGRSEYILRILSARGVRVGEAERERILSCTDVATLDQWFERSLNATTLSDVLDGPSQ